MTKDLTTGEPGKVLWRFSLPLMGSIIFQQLYNIADSLVAGKFIGDNALSAVGNAYEITLVYLAFAFGCNIGCSVVLSALFGAKEYTKLKTAVSTNFIASGVLCITLMIIGFIFTPNLLRLINTPKEIMADTTLYLNIYTGGLIFLFFYNISNGIFSALGDSITPFCFLAVSSTTNIFMDIWFVKCFGAGIAGVAWATFICQGVSCILAVITVFLKLKKIYCSEKPQLFSFAILRRIASIAVPSIIQQSFVSVGNIFIQSVVNSFGTSVIAGYAAAVKVNNFAISTFSTLGNAMSNFTAQNIGAGRIERVKKGVKSGFVLALLAAVIFSSVYIAFRKPLINLFRNGDASEALTVGCTFLLMVSPFFFFPAIKMIADGVTRGAGAMAPFMVATFTDLILRVVLASILSKPFESVGIWMAWPIGWGVATVMSFVFCKNILKRKSLTVV